MTKAADPRAPRFALRHWSAVFVLLFGCCCAAAATTERQLVFGSFANPTNAARYAIRVGDALAPHLGLNQGEDGQDVVVVSEVSVPGSPTQGERTMFRVTTCLLYTSPSPRD